MAIRRASHCGSWYTDSEKELNRQLDGWLNAADLTYGPARAIISPHAGYQYCGACAAHAFRQISPAVVRRIFILGPSHHVRLSGCTLSSASAYSTPFYDLKIDQQVYRQLKETGAFEFMSLSVDEAEHSLEMQLPYIAKVMSDFKDAFTIVPIMVGSLCSSNESLYGGILAPYFQDPSNLFVISSDFCHWGQRFRYQFYERSWGAIHESIEKLDHMGMDIIERLDPSEFREYLKKYSNTICGRHPIGLLLQMVSHIKEKSNFNEKMSFKFLKYAQSSQCFCMSDSSVSYASGALVFE